MDRQKIQDWREFCEGTTKFPPDHFSSLFMDLYQAPLTEAEKHDLQVIFSFVPNSSKTLEKMLRMDERSPDRTDGEIIEHVRKDASEIRRIITSAPILSVIDSGVIELTSDEDRFTQTYDRDMNRQFYWHLADYFSKEVRQNGPMMKALSNAFHGLASSLHLECALTASLLADCINLDNYFELYLIGVDYCLASDGILAMNYRAVMH
jgi:hypothetical protein